MVKIPDGFSLHRKGGRWILTANRTPKNQYDAAYGRNTWEVIADIADLEEIFDLIRVYQDKEVEFR